MPGGLASRTRRRCSTFVHRVLHSGEHLLVVGVHSSVVVPRRDTSFFARDESNTTVSRWMIRDRARNTDRPATTIAPPGTVIPTHKRPTVPDGRSPPHTPPDTNPLPLSIASQHLQRGMYVILDVFVLGRVQCVPEVVLDGHGRFLARWRHRLPTLTIHGSGYETNPV